MKIIKVKCKRLLFQNNNLSNCLLTFHNVTCNKQCRSHRLKAVEYSNSCICHNCEGKSLLSITLNKIRSIRSAITLSIKNNNTSNKSTHSELSRTSCCLNNTSLSSPSNSNSTEKADHNHVKIIGSISLVALVVNIYLMVKLCRYEKLILLDMFATSLTLFNILMSLYGLGMALFILIPKWWNLSKLQQNQYCQGFTSMKLFSLGSCVYSMVLLTYHRNVQKATDELREAIFRGVVLILEAVMFSGLFSVTCWIKLDHWDELCAIISPHTTIEWMFIAYETWYYLVTFALIIYYTVMMCHKRRLYFKRNRVRGRRKSKSKIEYPLFLMISLSFFIWLSGYLMTLPYFGIGFVPSAVIRICALMIPCVLQPFIYIFRNNHFCKCRPATKDDDKFLVCECKDTETCFICDSEYTDHRDNNRNKIGRNTFGSNLKGRTLSEDVEDVNGFRISRRSRSPIKKTSNATNDEEVKSRRGCVKRDDIILRENNITPSITIHEEYLEYIPEDETQHKHLGDEIPTPTEDILLIGNTDVKSHDDENTVGLNNGRMGRDSLEGANNPDGTQEGNN